MLEEIELRERLLPGTLLSRVTLIMLLSCNQGRTGHSVIFNYMGHSVCFSLGSVHNEFLPSVGHIGQKYSLNISPMECCNVSPRMGIQWDMLHWYC